MKKKIIAEISDITKTFGGLVALSNIDLNIKGGEIFGLIGPNGAGKTTLFNILTGMYRPTKGFFKLEDVELTRLPPHLIVKAGLARTFQNIRLFGTMTGLENVMVGCHVRTNIGVVGAILRHKGARQEEERIKDRARSLIDYVGLNASSAQAASTLSYGDQRRLEIARALATSPKVIALDEPAAGMNPTETSQLRELLVKIREDGITILLIEHDVKLVMGLCDTVAVLDYGIKIAEGTPSEIKSNPEVIRAYLGGDVP
ncbi:MAG: ABC transporter ATP-binding protein [Proteobacteria bacterium]|nr:ABC transporter ATP-binding protein [Pseudomonadota bacterium]